MKIGVIGLGSIGMRHANNLQTLGHKVIEYDNPNFSFHSEEHIKDRAAVIEQCDAMVIATPTKFHHHDAVECMAYGKPTFVEKPIGKDSFELSSFRCFLSTANLFVGYNLRMHDCVKEAKKWLDANRIGKPLWANFTCGQFNDRPAYLRDGVVLNWSHEIDLALHLLGHGHLEASSVRIVDEHDDMADILLTHENGCRSSIHLDYITKPEQRHFTIQGDEGRITCSLPSRNLFLLTPDKEQADWYLGKGSYDTDYMDEMKEFIRLIENPGTETCGCTGTEALRVLEICLQVRKEVGL